VSAPSPAVTTRPFGLRRSETLVSAMRTQSNQPTGARLSPVAMLALSGCAMRGAPSFVLFGSYFPAWLLCAVLGVAAAITARVVFVGLKLDSVLPYQLFLCAAVGLSAALLVWLIVFEA